jgi:hypothetical protein
MTQERLGLLAILMISALRCAVLYAYAQAPSVSEYQVKAAFVYNFAKFVDWPPTVFAHAQAPINLCIVGIDPFGTALETIKDKTVKDRQLVVQYKSRRENLGSCQSAFISASEREVLTQILASLHDTPILTVSDVDGFLESGGMINLITVANKIRFEVNLDAVRRAGLTISAQLLKLAAAVKGMP